MTIPQNVYSTKRHYPYQNSTKFSQNTSTSILDEYINYIFTRIPLNDQGTAVQNFLHLLQKLSMKAEQIANLSVEIEAIVKGYNKYNES